MSRQTAELISGDVIKKYNNKTYQVSYLEYRYLNLTETVTRLKKAIAPGKGTVVQINFTGRH